MRILCEILRWFFSSSINGELWRCWCGKRKENFQPLMFAEQKRNFQHGESGESFLTSGIADGMLREGDGRKDFAERK